MRDAGHRTAKKAKIIYPPPRGVDIIITARISGYASVVVLLEGDLLLYQSGAPPTVKNLRPPLQRQLHSFFFVFEHKLILMLCHQLRDNKTVFH